MNPVGHTPRTNKIPGPAGSRAMATTAKKAGEAAAWIAASPRVASSLHTEARVFEAQQQ